MTVVMELLQERMVAPEGLPGLGVFSCFGDAYDTKDYFLSTNVSFRFLFTS